MLEINPHSKWIKVVAVILIISLVLFLIPFPVAVEESVPEQGVDQVVNSLDQVDGQNNFTPGKIKGQNTLQKVVTAFGGKL